MNRHSCGKKGHLARVCRSKPKPQHPSGSNSQRGRRRTQRTHHLGDTVEENAEGTYSMFKVTTGKTRATPLMVTVKVNDKDLQMEVDTGASASVISEEVYGRLWKREDAPPLHAADDGETPHIHRREAGSTGIYHCQRTVSGTETNTESVSCGRHCAIRLKIFGAYTCQPE